MGMSKMIPASKNIVRIDSYIFSVSSKVQILSALHNFVISKRRFA